MLYVAHRAPGNRSFMSGVATLWGGPSDEEKQAKMATRLAYQRELDDQMKARAEQKKVC